MYGIEVVWVILGKFKNFPQTTSHTFQKIEKLKKIIRKKEVFLG